jgi:DNA polymerase-4
MTLRCLFVDFNAYFASCEQYDDARLRARPIGVVPVMAETSCCIAASYEAKACGVQTGTLVREARRLCPDMVFILARPARYVELHHALMAVIESCIHHAQPLSIDEVPCWLIGRERERGNAERIGHQIKRALIEHGYSPAIRCSIGVGPNLFLAKTASDMHKPDGLTVIELRDLPHMLHALALRDLCGIGPSMERRLHRAGIRSVAQLCAASPRQLRAAWGGIEGERFAAQLLGIEVARPVAPTASIGHSHVLDPQLRTPQAARSVLLKLLAKAAMRLRHKQLLASAMQVRVRFVGDHERLERDLAFAPIDDSRQLLHLLGESLQALDPPPGRHGPGRRPLSVSVTLTGLQPRTETALSLFDDSVRDQALNTVLDRINQRYGNNKLYFGSMQQALSGGAAPMRIPFSHVPDTHLEADAGKNELWLQAERHHKRLAEVEHRKHQRRQ